MENRTNAVFSFLHLFVVILMVNKSLNLQLMQVYVDINGRPKYTRNKN
jgi:hypothetical protein